MKASLILLTMFILTALWIETETKSKGLVDSGCDLTRVQNVQEYCSLKEPEERPGRKRKSPIDFAYTSKNTNLLSSSNKKAKARAVEFISFNLGGEK